VAELRCHASAGAVCGAVAGALTGIGDGLLSGAFDPLALAYLGAAGIVAGAVLGGLGGLLAGLAVARPPAPRERRTPRSVALAAAVAIFVCGLPPLVSIFSSAFRNRDLAALALAVAVAGLAVVGAFLGAAVAGATELLLRRALSDPRRISLASRIIAGILLSAAFFVTAWRYRNDINPSDAQAGALVCGWVLATWFAGRWLSRRRFRFGGWPWWARRGAVVVAVVCAYATYQMVTGSAPRAVASVRSLVTLGALALAVPEESAPPQHKAVPQKPDSARPAPAQAAPAGPKPSILLITLDSARADHLSLYGYARPTSPNLQAFAQRCAVFERAYAASSTERDALPALLSGRLPTQLVRTRGFWPKHHRGNRFLAEQLRAEGYRTAAVVSHAAHGERSGLAQGFERFELLANPGERGVLTGTTSPAVSERARKLLADASPDAPQFLWVHFADPHALYLRHRDGVEFGIRRADRYDGELAFTDLHLGPLLAAAEKSARPLIVVIAGDHGEAFGEHGRNGHGHTLFEEEVHVPLVVCAREVAARRISRPVSTLDLYPTLLQAAGARVPPGLAGTTLTAMLRGGAEERGPVLLEIPGAEEQLPTLALIDGSEKFLILGLGRVPRLFDLRADPAERRNIARLRPEVVSRLRAAAEKIRLPGAGVKPARGVRGVVSAADDAAEKEALRRSYEALKKREQEEGATPPAFVPPK
jgi:arylsulfatase A-like enzyme